MVAYTAETNGLPNGSVAHSTSVLPKQSASRQTLSTTEAVQNGFIMKFVIPLLMVVLMPNCALWIWYTVKFHDGSYMEFAKAFIHSPTWLFSDVWSKVTIASPFSLYVIGGYMLFQVILMKTVPGEMKKGPVTVNGNTPVYVDNGFRIYLITMATFAILTYYLKSYTSYSPSLVHDNYGDLLATMNVFSLVFCFGLYLKGIYLPSTSDSGTSGNPLFDYYWGTELYPRAFGIDLKVFTNCRFGCTVWALIPCCFAIKAYETYGFEAAINNYVSLAILLVYLTKFFWWEFGYMCTIDIILDRAGFYICWGCLCYIPAMYASFSYYMACHPRQLGYPHSLAVLLAGLSCVAINYLADWQRQDVRQTDGKTTIWNRPPKIIRAKYTTSQGEERSSILLVSGFWGLARHFHYLPELGLAFFWTVPSGFSHLLPYTYILFLAILLVHRTFRDDIKCSNKYGQYWQQYKQQVPYRIVPYIF